MGDDRGVPDSRLRQIAEEAAESAAEKAVVKVFRLLRIRIDDEGSIDEFIDNQRFVKSLRGGGVKVAGLAGSAVMDLAKKGLQALLLAAIMAAGAGLGIHFGSPLPASPAALGAHQ